MGTIKNNRLGFKFRRQHPVHLFIVDFYCHQFKLVIEVDGEYHQTTKQQVIDHERENLLKFQDFEIMRFNNDEVIYATSTVIKKILNKINELKGSQDVYP